jgi:hypothetical protein
MPDLIESHQPFATADVEPKKILSSEIIRAKEQVLPAPFYLPASLKLN